MTKHKIIFSIDSTSQLIIPLKDPVEWLGPLYLEKILLVVNLKKNILSKSTVYHDLLDLADLLNKALKQQLFLHHSITKDLGYLDNERLCNDADLPTQSFSNGGIAWVGYKYHLWSARNKLISLNSWIYNNPNGSIILEVTPLYPYMFCEPEEEPDYIPYEEWIKTYEPYFITTLSRETAQQWLDQAERIIKIIEDNQKRWDRGLTEDDVES